MCRRRIIVIFAPIALLFLAAVTFPAWMWVVFPLKGYHALNYPNGVTFTGTAGEDLTIVSWYTRPGEKEPCPLTVHLPDGDLTPAYLADGVRLRRDGWEECKPGGGQKVELRYGGFCVRCWFEGETLTHMEVNARVAQEENIGPVAVSIDGKRVSLPASEEQVANILGLPTKK
jgi:hypothetical protein